MTIKTGHSNDQYSDRYYYPVPPAPPASPILPPEDQLDPVFIPAEVMTVNNHLLPEKFLTTNGEPAAYTDKHRNALADNAPRSILPTIAPSIVSGATEFHSINRPLIRKASAHVFLNLTEPAPVQTVWELQPVLNEGMIGTKIDQIPILPAPTSAMIHSGEGYIIRDADTGKVLSTHTDGTLSKS